MPKKKNGHIVRGLNIADDNSSFGYVEAYKALRTNIQYLMKDTGKGKVLLVTSAIPGEGKSNVAVNLANTFARDDKRVILIDGDLRKGTLHRYLNVPALSPGLSAVLNREIGLSSVIIRIQQYGFDFIPVGALPSNPSELAGSTTMSNLLSVLTDTYDYVIMDSAPVNSVADTTIMCRFVDGVILVVSHNDVTRNTVLAAKQQLDNVNANILGVVLNKYDARNTGSRDANYYSYYNYDSYDDYGYGENDRN